MPASFVPATLLVVDDDPTNIEVIHAILGEKYRVIFATNGLEALDLCRAQHPDLIILDVMMPEMDGYELLARLRAAPETADIPVIFLTALGTEHDEQRGLELGAVDYLTKPVSPSIARIRVANQLELKRSRDLLTDLSTTDVLTGIANRRRFNMFLEQSWRGGIAASSPVSIAMIDVDNFKEFNDNHGHTQGDVCLQQVATCLARAMKRNADLVARYGGEEFACILPETGASDAAGMAAELHAVINLAEIPHGFSPTAPHVTVSIGVATLLPEESTDPGQLIELADTALYQAKKAGRNQVVAMRPKALGSPI